MTMVNDYIIQLIHEQREHDLLAAAEESRLRRQAADTERLGADQAHQPWWRWLSQPRSRQPRRSRRPALLSRRRPVSPAAEH